MRGQFPWSLLLIQNLPIIKTNHWFWSCSIAIFYTEERQSEKLKLITVSQTSPEVIHFGKMKFSMLPRGDMTDRPNRELFTRSEISEDADKVPRKRRGSLSYPTIGSRSIKKSSWGKSPAKDLKLFIERWIIISNQKKTDMRNGQTRMRPSEILELKLIESTHTLSINTPQELEDINGWFYLISDFKRHKTSFALHTIGKVLKLSKN